MGNGYSIYKGQLSWRDVSGQGDARYGRTRREAKRLAHARRQRTEAEQESYLQALAEKIRPFITGREVKTSYLTEKFDATRFDVLEAIRLLGARCVDGAFYTMDPA